MDGVLVRGSVPIPGAMEFLGQLNEECEKDSQKWNYLVVTNNSSLTPKDLAYKLQRSGLMIPHERIFTSAMATAYFLESQKPKGTAYVIGESGLTQALHSVDYVITDDDPDYVVLGETVSWNYDLITKAIKLIRNGSKFIATNPDVTIPVEDPAQEKIGRRHCRPGCGSMTALIEKASGVEAFNVGKPNPFMMRAALNFGGMHSDSCVMVGDSMTTDVLAGLLAGLRTVLVLSGNANDLSKHSYRPNWVFESIAHLPLFLLSEEPQS